MRLAVPTRTPSIPVAILGSLRHMTHREPWIGFAAVVVAAFALGVLAGAFARDPRPACVEVVR